MEPVPLPCRRVRASVRVPPNSEAQTCRVPGPSSLPERDEQLVRSSTVVLSWPLLASGVGQSHFLWWTVAGERLRLKLGPGLTSLAKATGGGSRHKTTMGVPAFSQDFNLRWAFLVSEGIEFYGITTAFSARSRNWEAQVCQMKL